MVKAVPSGCSLLIFSSLVPSTALAPQNLASNRDSTLPDAPEPQQAASPPAVTVLQQTGTGSITGTVLDTNRKVLQGARVTLAGPSGSAMRTVESGMNGQFAFTGLPPDVYTLTVTASGMNTFTSPRIPQRPSEDHIVPAVTLSVSTVSTSVTVTAGTRRSFRSSRYRLRYSSASAASFPTSTAPLTGTRRPYW
jgi:carboxypeptidase family protein